MTDNGPAFVSAEFEQFLKKNGIHHKTSAPYHPATNGQAERAVQTVKRGIKKMKLGTLQDTAFCLPTETPLRVPPVLLHLN